MLKSLPLEDFNAVVDFPFTADLASFVHQIPPSEYPSVVREILKGVSMDKHTLEGEANQNLSITHLGEKLSATIGFTPANLVLINFRIALEIVKSKEDPREVHDILRDEFKAIRALLTKVLGEKVMSREFFYQQIHELVYKEDLGDDGIHRVTFRRMRRRVMLHNILAEKIQRELESDEIAQEVVEAWWWTNIFYSDTR